MRRDLRAPIGPVTWPQGVTLVPFTPTTARDCRDLMNRVYGNGFGDVIDFDVWWPRLESDSEYHPPLCFVAARDGQTVGFCQCWTNPFIKDIVVAPDATGQGIGAALLGSALTAFKARGATHVDLKTDTDNLRAQALYRRLGFVIVERFES